MLVFYSTKNSYLKDERSIHDKVIECSNKKNKNFFFLPIASHINDERKRRKNHIKYTDRESMQKNRTLRIFFFFFSQEQNESKKNR